MDQIGVCASALCAVHCVLTGAAMGLLAFFGLEFLGNPVLEGAFFLVAILVGGWAVFHGIKKHHSRVPATVFVSGVCLIVGAHLAEQPLGHEHWLVTVLAALGGLSIASFHFLNLRFQHRNCSCSR